MSPHGRQFKTLLQIERLPAPVVAMELSNPRCLMPLAQHGYVRMTVELTDKGRDHIKKVAGAAATLSRC